jgi:uncharacterized protein (DUF1684 family)
MKSSNIIVIIFAIALIGVLFYTMQETASPEAYLKEIEKERADKDHFMRTSSESPFADDASSFKGLKYFPIDPSFRVMASLTPVEEKKVIVLPTSDGLQQHYLPYAYADFELEDEVCHLLILEVMEEGIQRGSLFLAFGDSTSASETYGAGRYLDIKKTPGSTSMTLDFNKAYNPYCAYTEKYSCPLPPTENLLRVAIKAGEKSYH